MSNFKTSLLLTTAFFMISVYQSTAQNTDKIPVKRSPVKTINYEQGLMNNAIWDVITDSRGFTWISTKTGIQRYNGYLLEAVTIVTGNDTVPINYPVHFLRELNGNIFIGYKNGILEFSAKTNSFRKIISDA